MPSDPQPVVFPRDDGPHSRLTEWWYYTGHLLAADGHRYGFEFVIFRAERGPLPVKWASHVALTDESGNRFGYAQRTEIGPQVDRSPRDASGAPTGFSLAITGLNLGAFLGGAFGGSGSGSSAVPSAAPSGSAASSVPWSMSGSGGRDHLVAALSPAEASAAGLPELSFDLSLDSRKPPVLHSSTGSPGSDGWLDFGAAGGSYYYSRTSMAVTGTLAVGGSPVQVTGDAWFDHQWGDFIAVGAGGWDWFAVNLGDGTEIMLSLVRAEDGTYPLEYGTIVGPDGKARHLAQSDFRVTVTGHWASPRTGATYPAGWTVEIPGEGLRIELSPSVAAQELDTRASTGVVYWEGSQRVSATRNGSPVSGEAYVELTGYRTSH